MEDFIVRELNKIHFAPDYIGVSMSFSNGHTACLKMINACKKLWPASKIIVGGMHATTFTSKIISEPDIDIVLRGLGDISFIELLKALDENKNPENIPGVVAGMHNITNFGQSLTCLDDIPPYPYDLIDMEYLITHETSSPTYEGKTRTGLILMSRGCPFHCTYCSFNKIHGRTIYFKSLERVLSEIEYLVDKYKIEELCIMDDLFGVNKKYFYDFFAEISRRKINLKLVIASGLSLLVFNEEMIDELIRHGLKIANFPLESGSQYVQNEIMKKHINLAKARRLITYAKKKGLFVNINIVTGLPGETRELMNETIGFIKTLPIDWTSFFIAYPYPGTRMTEIFLERGELTEDKLIEVWDSSSQGFKSQHFKERPFDTKEFTGEELSEIIYDYNIELNFFNNYNFKVKNYKSMLLKLDKVIDRYSYHVVALSCRAKCYFNLGEIHKAKEDIIKMYNIIKSNAESRNMHEKYRDKIEETINFTDELLEKIDTGNNYES